jgi:hypothetical protein
MKLFDVDKFAQSIETSCQIRYGEHTALTGREVVCSNAPLNMFCTYHLKMDIAAVFCSCTDAT